ncbi:MAG: 30S ribosomal protein S15 [Proteobacteria bacterium]|nr:30S ribosomal protein S15 [Pseudomonadota bacterium]
MINKRKIIEEFETHSTDTGSVEVQCAILTNNILRLTDHCKSHKKDFQCRKSLISMVNRRKKLMRYFARKDQAKHVNLLQRLNLKK